MRRPPALRLAGLMCFGVFLGLGGIEVAMRAVSGLIEKRIRSAGSPSAKPGACRILCLGESTTMPPPMFVKGAVDTSWPAQLERILSSEYPTMKFQIVNKGRGATTSAAILANLPDYIARYSPRIVISMMGLNDNQWYGIVRFDPGWRGRLERFLGHLRIWKLSRYVYFEFMSRKGRTGAATAAGDSLAVRCDGSDGLSSASMPLKQCFRLGKAGMALRRKAAAALEACRAAASQDPEDPRPYEMMTMLCQNDNRLSEVIFNGYRAWRRNSRDPHLYFYLGMSLEFKKLAGEAERAFLRCVEMAERQGCHDMLDVCNRNLAELYYKGGKPRQARKFYLKSIAAYPGYRPKNLDIEAAPSVRRAQVRLVTQANYRTLAKMLRERRINLIAMGYAGWNVDIFQKMLRGFPEVAFVDNKPYFDRALRSTSYESLFSDRFKKSWGHCTTRGNRIIAENAATAFRSLLSGGALAGTACGRAER